VEVILASENIKEPSQRLWRICETFVLKKTPELEVVGFLKIYKTQNLPLLK
jgi:hypothetical protein